MVYYVPGEEQSYVFDDHLICLQKCCCAYEEQSNAHKPLYVILLMHASFVLVDTVSCLISGLGHWNLTDNHIPSHYWSIPILQM